MKASILRFGVLLLFLAACNGPVVIGLSSSKMEDGDFLKIVSVSSGNVLTAGGSDATEGRPIIVSPWSGSSSQKWMAVEALVAGNSFLLMPQRQRYPWARFIRNGGTDPFRNRHDDLPDWTMVIEANTNTGQVTQDARDGKLYQQWRAEKIDSTASNGKKRFILKNRQNNQCLQAPGPAPSSGTSQSSTVSTTTTTTTPAPITNTTTKKPSFFGSIWSSIRSAFGGGSSNSNDDSSSSARTTRSNSQQSVGGTSGSSSTSATGNVLLAPCDSTDLRQQWQLESLPLEHN